MCTFTLEGAEQQFPFLSCDNFLTLFVICWSFDSFMRGGQNLKDESFSDKGNMPKRLFSGSTSTICFISFPTLFMTFLFITQGFLSLPPPALSIHPFIHSCMYDAFFVGHVFCDLYTSFRRTWTFFFSFYRLHVEARQPVDGEEQQKRSDERHVDVLLQQSWTLSDIIKYWPNPEDGNVSNSIEILEEMKMFQHKSIQFQSFLPISVLLEPFVSTHSNFSVL